MSIRRTQHIRRINFVALPLLALFYATAPSFAQSFRGAIRGTMTDPSGGVVPGAKITATNLATGEARDANTADDGTYVLAELPAGEYELTFEKAGFLRRTVRTRVSTGADTTVDSTLALPGGDVIEVQVNDTAPLVEASNTTLSQVVDRALVEELPLNGRDFGKLVALTPGVTVEGSGVAGAEKGFGQFNINGNRDRSNNYTLDGTDNNDPWFNNSALNQVGITGAPATLLPLDAIQEFNLESNFHAEYGRNSRSAVNIVTRSGTNSLHGSLYEYFRNSELTQTAFRDGWFYPGDIGSLTADNMLIVSGRLKTVMNIGGDKVSPEKIETTLMGFAGVERAGVLSVTNAFGIEEVWAAIASFVLAIGPTSVSHLTSPCPKSASSELSTGAFFPAVAGFGRKLLNSVYGCL